MTKKQCKYRAFFHYTRDFVGNQVKNSGILVVMW